MSKNKETLNNFIEYCKKHPEERFWQALRNWSSYNYIYGSYSFNSLVTDSYDLIDTFMKRGK